MKSVAYEHIFFDWDGCLASTLDLWLELYRQALERRGIRAEDARIVRELFNDWSGPSRFGVVDIQDFAGEIRRALEQRIGTVELNPGAREVLTLLKSSGRKIAILTGSSRSFVEPVLARKGLGAVVDLLLALDDVRNLKPHPEAVNRALAAFSASREQALLVGDSSKDIEMGKNAAVATALYFPDRNRCFYEPESLLSSSPDFVIRELAELPGIAGLGGESLCPEAGER